MSNRNPNGLAKLYRRYPTNEEIEQDFKRNIDLAWLGLTELYKYLSACHQDGLLDTYVVSVERALQGLATTRDSIDRELECDFHLELPPDSESAKVAALSDSPASEPDEGCRPWDDPRATA
jgi:hypothetical protein